MYKLGFIGAGHMGGALAEAACRGGDAEDVIICDANMDHAASVAARLDCTMDCACYVAENSEFIFIGVKPQNIADLFEEIAPVLSERKDRFVLVSMAAGITMERITALVGINCPIIRIMPNTPVAVEAGCVLYAANSEVTADEVSRFLKLMHSAGKFVELEEDLIDAGCAVSGCGPAFVYKFILAMAEAGEKCGLPEDKALELAEQTVFGAAKLALNGGQDPNKLCSDVCSPGGSTIEGVKKLNAGAFSDEVASAIKASFDRTKELSGC
ncbi:MAG: pyrroline-5-carboxylate reductase [Oscillospiraceae bacterium]